MLPSTSLREALLACPSSPIKNLPFFTVRSTLSSPCFRSDTLFLAKVRLSLTLTLSHLTIWCFGLTALFLFVLAEAALAYLPTAHSVVLKPFPFQQAQYAQVSPLKPGSFCKIFSGLGSTNKSASFLLLSDSRSVLSSIFPPTSISLAGTVFSLLLFYQATVGSRTLVSFVERRG